MIVLQSAKSRAAALQIEQWRQEDPNAKIIVFTQFRGMIKVMKRICDERKWGCTPFHGSMTFQARDKAVKSFTNDPECFVMLCGLKAGGVGLNLTAANRVIIIDLWWNQFVETQAFCRVYRIGQDRDVEMVRFVVKDSVDEDIISMQERKNDEIDQAIDSKYRPGRLTTKELLQLFDTDLDRDENGEPIVGPNEEPFILTKDPYHESSYIEYNSD
jgi:SNF2 family DNA or RNA helicase